MFTCDLKSTKLFTLVHTFYTFFCSSDRNTSIFLSGIMVKSDNFKEVAGGIEAQRFTIGDIYVCCATHFMIIENRVSNGIVIATMVIIVELAKVYSNAVQHNVLLVHSTVKLSICIIIQYL